VKGRPQLIDSDTHDALNRDADHLATLNRVELCWLLRGIADALLGIPPGDWDPGVHEGDYLRGYRAVLAESTR
jgi:hypothetical protein